MLKRKEIVERIAQKGYTKKDAGVAFDDVFNVITEALVAGESVQVYGFGVFDVKNIAQRETIDYQSKKRILIPSYKAPKFTAGKLLKRAIKEGYVRN